MLWLVFDKTGERRIEMRNTTNTGIASSRKASLYPVAPPVYRSLCRSLFQAASLAAGRWLVKPEVGTLVVTAELEATEPGDVLLIALHVHLLNIAAELAHAI